MLKLALLFTLLQHVMLNFGTADLVRLNQLANEPDAITDQQIASIDKRYNSSLLQRFTRPLLVVRYVRSPGHRQVRKYLNRFLKSKKWIVDEDNFKATMPNGTAFDGSNIIASSKPVTANTRRLVLACHWDSKYFARNSFIGATDSAIPCGILLWLAAVFQPLFNNTTNANLLASADVALQLVFFDGEEAIEQWTSSDSIYGAKNLATRWQREGNVSTIDLLVLLDLLGASNPYFHSYFDDTAPFFDELADAEVRLQRLWLSSGGRGASRRIANMPFLFGYSPPVFSGIEDDHLPFQRRGVPILHLIPSPFPEVWHTVDDTEENIDWPTVDRIARILTIFTLRQLNAMISVSNNNSAQSSNNNALVF